jgi:hypothetical protein
MKKWGISYNVFDDAHEVFLYSLKSVRPHVDFISVVYQTVSNRGEKYENPSYLPDLTRWKEQGLIDDLYLYDPMPGVNNELVKRNVGRDRCLQVGCDYLMNMDSDELYIGSEFEYMKKEMVEGDYDGSACKMLTYYKTSEYILDPPQEYYVPLMYKADPNRYFGTGFPAQVDPTRGMMSTKPRIFTRDEIQMHHMSYIRYEVRRKLRNSSAYGAIAQVFEHMVNRHVNFDGQTANADGRDTGVRKLENPPFEIFI